MKKYKFFVTYFSVAFSHFAYAVLTPPTLPTLPILPILPALPIISLSEDDFRDLKSLIRATIKEYEESHPSTSAQAQEPANQEHVLDMQALLTLEFKHFIRELNNLKETLAIAQLISEDNIAEFILLFDKIAKQNPKKGTPDFDILNDISNFILQKSYDYFSENKLESLFLFMFDSALIGFPDTSNVGTYALFNFYAANSIGIGLNSPFVHALSLICNEKRSGSGERETVYSEGKRIYISRYFDFDISKSAIILADKLMPALRILFEKMLHKVGYFEMGKAILKNLSEDNIIKSHQSLCANSIDLALLLLDIEINAPTSESTTRIQEILTITQEFTVQANSYFQQKIFDLSCRALAKDKELASLIQSYGDADRLESLSHRTQ